MQLYFAHDTRSYRTVAEKRAADWLEKAFPAYTVLNPSTEVEQPRRGRTGKQVMQDCLKAVTKSDILVFTAYQNREIRRGVYQEVETAIQQDIPVYWLLRGRLVPLSEIQLTPINGIDAYGDRFCWLVSHKKEGR